MSHSHEVAGSSAWHRKPKNVALRMQSLCGVRLSMVCSSPVGRRRRCPLRSIQLQRCHQRSVTHPAPARCRTLGFHGRPHREPSQRAGFPFTYHGRFARESFRGMLGVHLRHGLHVRRVSFRTAYAEGFSRLVTSTTAPITTGWSFICTVWVGGY